MRNENISVQFLEDLNINFDKIQSVAEICWFVEAHAVIAQVIFKGVNYTDVIS